jgi:hypothetical protein
MQDLEKAPVKRYEMYTLGNKLFIFDSSIRIETYQNKWYYGIIFFFPNEGDGLISKDGRYDVVHHYHMDWERLLINNKDGVKDLPFHSGTFRFLPDEIKVLEL